MVVVVVVVMILIGHIVYRNVPIPAIPVIPAVPVIPGVLITILMESVMVNIIFNVLKFLCLCLSLCLFISLSPLSLSLSLACGINYCLDCNRYGDCTRCRNGTLLTTSHPHHCIGNHLYGHTHSVGLIFCVFMPKQQF